MTNRIPAFSFSEFRPLHFEELAEDQPLNAATLMDLMSAQAGLYEYLCDAPVPGNELQTITGHAHGRRAHDGAYVARHSTVSPGFLPIQECETTEMTPVSFVRLDLGGPTADGSEAGQAQVRVNRPVFYLDRDFTTLEMSVLLRCEGDGQAEACLELHSGGMVIADSHAATASSSWQPMRLGLAVPNDERADGFVSLALYFRATAVGSTAYICGADPLAKPLSGSLAPGILWLKGEAL